MDITVSTTDRILEENSKGVLLLAGTRIPIDTIVFDFNDGAAPEEIVLRYPSLSLPRVYATISHYLQNRSEIDRYLKVRKKRHASLKATVESAYPPAGIRQRLLARKTAQGNGK